MDPELDREWREEIELEIGLHPDLPSRMKAAVELDHGMEDGRLILPVRAALLHYLLRWMRADLDPARVGYERSQIVLLNKEAVDARQKALREESARRLEEAKVARLEVP